MNLKEPQTEANLREYIKHNYINSDDWYIISAYQTLSEDFIREFQDKIDWHFIGLNDKSIKNIPFDLILLYINDMTKIFYIETFQYLPEEQFNLLKQICEVNK